VCTYLRAYLRASRDSCDPLRIFPFVISSHRGFLPGQRPPSQLIVDTFPFEIFLSGRNILRVLRSPRCRNRCCKIAFLAPSLLGIFKSPPFVRHPAQGCRHGQPCVARNRRRCHVHLISANETAARSAVNERIFLADKNLRTDEIARQRIKLAGRRPISRGPLLSAP